MITRFLITVAFALAALTFKASYDVYWQKKGIWTAHFLESSLLLIVGLFVIICIFTYNQQLNWHIIKGIIADLLFLMGIGWPFFDRVHNFFAGMPGDYVSADSPHQSFTDWLINRVGRRWQFELKGFVLAVILIICYFITKN